MKYTAFIDEGAFYKGNLHCHSNLSDGNLSPAELAEAYKNQGYSFLAFTDHNLYSNYTEFNTADFITIPGIEANPTMPGGDIRAYHFVAIPGESGRIEKAALPMFAHGERTESGLCRNDDDLQAFIDNLYNRGYQVTLAHPHWSRVEYDQIVPLQNLFAVEIYNNCSQALENVGESSVCYDALLRSGKRIWCTAVDDNHNSFPLGGAKTDSFGGFIRVKAKSLCERDICDAIAAGSFYASQGPEIYEFYVQDGTVHFTCSPCARIYITGDARQRTRGIVEEGEPLLTELTYRLSGDEAYVRVDCYDEAGRRAYTNPIWL